ncbi:MAG: hypothetical protein CMP40_03525 [Rickettsiales bacterium]|nr:hypothetical protein [Rickettsiales bacterium]
MTNNIKIFNNLKEIGSFLKKNRRLKGKKLYDIAKILVIKKDLLSDFEEGNITIEKFNNNSHLKGFLNSYIKYLNLEGVCRLNLLQSAKVSDLKKSNLRLKDISSKETKYGSLLILLSLILIGLTYLFWSKNTYLNLHLLSTAIK